MLHSQSASVDTKDAAFETAQMCREGGAMYAEAAYNLVAQLASARRTILGAGIKLPVRNLVAIGVVDQR